MLKGEQIAQLSIMGGKTMKVYMKKVTKQRWAWLLAFVMTVSIIIPASLLSVKAEVTNPVIKEAEGWLESAYAEWTPVTGATGYNVYVKSTLDTAYVKLDDELIRLYQDDNGGKYYRADAVGLKAGSYVMKLVPIVGGNEVADKAALTDTLRVEAYDRTGFAWTNGTSSGAYNEDGTLKNNAVVLYITEQTKDTVTMEVVTSSKGATTLGTGLQNILNLIKKGYESRPVAIRMIGNVTDFATMDGGDIVIDENNKAGCDGITFEGIGEDATANGWGIRIKNSNNVEIRNIGTMNCNSSEGDNIGLQQGNDHVWVHNCDFFYGDAGSDKDQVKGDGALDCKKSTYVTFSYNHFFDSGKSNLLGLSEGTTEGLYITYHHNWYDHSDSRHPRVRYYSAHVYNNYYDGNSKYGIGACLGSSIYAEGNYFRNCKFPMMTSMQGSDVIKDWSTLTRDEANMATFSKENGGSIKAYNNYMTGQQSFVSYQENSTEFDAYVVSSASETVPSTVTSYKGGNTYNNFDTSTVMYEYTAQSPAAAKATVETYAGRVNGGDFKWTFNNEVDDTSNDVITELKSALKNYQTKLISVGGGSAEDSSGSEESSTQAPTQAPTNAEETSTVPVVTGAQIHNFTTDGIDSSFYKIVGNLSSSKGTVNYDGLTLTQCLKMESATNIEFNTAVSGTLTLVFNSDFAKKTDIDNVKYNAASGILTLDVEPGFHTIKKGDSANLFYIAFTPDVSEAPTEVPKQAPTEAPTETPYSADVNPSAGYDKNSANYSGAYTSLSSVKDEQFVKKVYVAANGTASGAGTKASPLDLETAINNATAGTAIIVLGGTYTFNHQITIAYGNNGSADCYKVLKAADGEDVIFDFSSQAYGDTATNARGLQMEGDYWYVFGITCKGAADNGIFIAGSNNVVERCVLKGNRDTGLQISRQNSSLSDMKDWPSNNYIINCTSFDNSDPATGENADGFAAKLTCGEGNVFDGCIAYSNCDDGWDLYAKEATGSIGVVTIRNCVAFNNGTLTNGNSEANGDMNGFKLGGSNGNVPTAHFVFNCLAFNNGKDGFTDNGNGAALTIANCTSFGNTKNNFNFYRTVGGTFLNLLSADGNATDKFVGRISNSITYNSKKYYQVPYSIMGTEVTSGQKLGTEVSNPTSSGAFVNTTAPDVTTNIDSVMRNSDGTVTTNGYLMSTGSFASMGAKYNVANQLLDVKAYTTGSSYEPEAPTEAPTEATGVVLELNASNMSTATFTSSFIQNGFGILATDGNPVSVDANNKSWNEVSYTKRLKLGGAGSTEYRSVKFETVGASTITVVAMSSSSSADRTMQLLDASGNVLDSKVFGGTAIGSADFTVSGAGTYYIASLSGGINIYDVKVSNGIALTSLDEN